jgi:hypothetical protein
MSELTRPAPRILALWSAPRSTSTAFFRMMLERDDFQVLHEPFSYLAEFGYVDVDGDRLTDGEQLIARIRELSQTRPVFFKDTTDERYPAVLADHSFLAEDATHTFLIRDPRRTITSYQRINPEFRPEQIGFGHQAELFDAVAAATGSAPLVLDAEQFGADAEATVRGYCATVGIPFRPDAMTWSAGTRAEWGPSAKWHEEVSRSTGFAVPPAAPQEPDPFARDDRLASVLAGQRPHYEHLHEYVGS